MWLGQPKVKFEVIPPLSQFSLAEGPSVVAPSRKLIFSPSHGNPWKFGTAKIFE